MNAIYEFFKEIVIAYKDGPIFIKRLVVVGIVFTSIALISAGVGDSYKDLKFITQPIVIGFGIPGGIFLFGVFIYRQTLEQAEKEKKYEEVEKRYKENPKETQAAWDLARIKLESYLDRNLKQVRAIFWLTIFVMIAGFTLVAFGVYTVIDSPDKVVAAVIASVSGILINFIGATFLVLYKSTMAQAKDYVSVLERINAVGMSVQILDTLESDDENVKQKATADLSKQLLSLYSKA